MIERIKKILFKKKWRKYNRDNETVAVNLFDLDKVSVGKRSYGGLYVLQFNSDNCLSIGNYCSIGPNVIFILSADHYLKHISTFPFKVKIIKEKYEATSKGDIIVEDDVWIGYGSIILSGVRIGQGAVIGAGSIVTKDVPPYSIVCGNPAKVVKYRFNKDIINELMKIDFEQIDDDFIKGHIDYFYKDVDDIDTLIDIPKKRTN